MNLSVGDRIACAFALRRKPLRLREVHRLSGVSLPVLSARVRALEEANVLWHVSETPRVYVPSKSGKGVHFLARGLLVLRELGFAVFPWLERILLYEEEVIPPLSMLLVYGSVLMHPEKAGDVDMLLITGRLSDEEEQRLKKRLRRHTPRHVHLITLRVREWKLRVARDDPYARSILATALPVVGIDAFARWVRAYGFERLRADEAWYPPAYARGCVERNASG